MMVMTPKASNNKIMVVDDDPAVRHLIARFFGYNNYQIETAPDANTARLLFRQFNPDLVILDVNLPDDSGFTLCKEIRPTGTLVLMLTCMTDTNYVLEGFEQGADDYIAKPFDIEILKAKIGALFKRKTQVNAYRDSEQKRLIFNELMIDPDRCEVMLKGELIPLTSLEFELLFFLASHPNRVWERTELLIAVWGPDNIQKADRKVDVHIGQIRKKIDDLDGNLIRTVRGKGYMFELPETEETEPAQA